ncbi:MAG: hypothetical protein M0Q44_07275 [Methylobacter sp.]|nr:hypothetical protein [Methylobacter sp.]
MAYKPLRKDLTEITRKCDFCPKFLTSLKAYVLEDEESGKIAYAGPTCAKDNIGANYTLTGIPDLTRFTLPNGKSGGSGGGSGASVSGNNASAAPNRLALEYLLLREEKLAGDMQTSYSVLKNYYDKSKTESLTDAELRHINNIETKAPESLRLANLQKCYNYLFWIDVGIKRLPAEKIKFLSDIRRALVKNGEINQAQKNGVNKWLKHIQGVPQIK